MEYLFAPMLLFLLLVSAPRGADGEAALQLELKQALKLDAGPVLGPGTYLVEWTGSEVVLTSVTQDVRVPGSAKPMPPGTRAVSVMLNKKGNRVALAIRLERESITLPAEWVSERPRVGLDESKSPASLPASMPATDAEPDVWKHRYRPQLQHCVERKWPLDKYEKCVCPLAMKFRMPPAAGNKAFPLDERTIVSLTIDNNGKVIACVLKQ